MSILDDLLGNLDEIDDLREEEGEQDDMAAGGMQISVEQ